MHDPLLDPPSWAPSWLPTVDDVRGFRMLRWLVSAVFVAGVAGCVTESADRPADPVLAEPTTTAPVPEPEPGSLGARFGTAATRLVAVSGEVVELCLLHADTPEQRAEGLMQVTDLEGYDGMLFSNDEPSDGSFYMFRTLLPLTIAWWDGEGGFVSRTDMVPCESDDPAACERYPPAGPYRFAIEVVQGAPVAERFEPDTRLEVTGGACAPAV